MKPPSICVVLLAALACVACGGPYTLWSGKTPDRRHDLEVIEKHGRQHIRIDARTGPGFHAVAPSSLTLSSDGNHLAYAAQKERGWVVVRDGDEGAEWDAVGAIALSAHGKRLAYAALRARRWYVVVDDQVVDGYDGIFTGTLRISDDEEHVVFAAAYDGSTFVVTDGRAGPKLDGVGRLVMSRDGAHVVHVGRLNGFAYLVIDGALGEPWKAINDFVVGDHGRVVFLGRKSEGEVRLVSRWLDGPARVDDRDGIGATGGLALSSDDEHVAWIAHVATDDVVFIDGRRSETAFLDVSASSLTFRPGTSEIAFVARDQNGRRSVVIGPHTSTPFDEIEGSRVVFSKDGSRSGFTGRRDGTSIVVLDGFEQRPQVWASRPVLSADGKRAAYLARRGRRMAVVVDGESHDVDIAIDGTLAFSAGASHWACVAGSDADRELYFLVDGRRRDTLDFREIVSVSSRFTLQDIGRGRADDVLRSWAAAEAERATAP